MDKFFIHLIIISLCIFSSFRAEAQKLYVWLPVIEDFVQHPLFEATDTVDIIIFDGRNVPSKSKVECSSEDFIAYPVKDIQHTYEGTTFNVLTAAMYFKDTEDGHVTIKVGIAAYQAGFGADLDIAIRVKYFPSCPPAIIILTPYSHDIDPLKEECQRGAIW